MKGRGPGLCCTLQAAPTVMAQFADSKPVTVLRMFLQMRESVASVRRAGCSNR